MTLVLNLYGGPCVGKSTLAAGVFYKMKGGGHNVELVTEVAKAYVWEDRKKVLDNQLYILTEQYHNMFRLIGQTDLIITDAPLLNCAAYFPDDYPDHVMQTVKWMHDQFTNINFMIDRGDTFVPNGRRHSLEQSKVIDDRVKKIMTNMGQKYQLVDANDASANRITMTIIDRLEQSDMAY